MNFVIPSECIECGTHIEKQGHIECLSCGKPCEPIALNPEAIDDMAEGEMMGFDIKSKCCNADVQLVDIRSTCSNECHEKVYMKMEQKMGEFIYDQDPEGVLRKIPTRDIYEKGGLTMDELRSYPKADITAQA